MKRGRSTITIPPEMLPFVLNDVGTENYREGGGNLYVLLEEAPGGVTAVGALFCADFRRTDGSVNTRSTRSYFLK